MIIPRQTQTSAAVALHYDQLDRYYREMWGEHVHHGLWLTGREPAEVAVVQLVDHVAEAANIQNGDRVCDVGCGYGGASRHLADQYNATVTGLTISEAQHKYACEQTAGGNPTYLLRNWEQNELDTASFDALISIECVSHVVDKKRYFSEVQRVLKPGGKAAIIAWLADEKPHNWEVRHLLEPICSEGRLPSMASRSEYEKLMQDAGLQLKSYDDLSKKVRRTWSICAQRLAANIVTSSHYRSELWKRRNTDWIFAVTLLRILAAYYSGAMKYGLFVLEKPASGTAE